MRLVTNGRPGAVIYTETETFAAEELQRILFEMSGARLPMTDLRDTEQPMIVVGSCSKMPLNLSGLPDQAYLVRAGRRRLHLTGKDRLATLHAVYTFLEEELGCAWCGLGKDGETLPRKRTIEVKTLDKTFKPDLPLRGLSAVRAGRTDVLDWMVRNRQNLAMVPLLQDYVPHRDFFLREVKEKRGMLLAAGIHAAQFWVPSDVYRKKHPDYYAEVGGRRGGNHLCVSNPGVAAVAAENVVRFLETRPGIDLLGLSLGDGGGFCECRECMKLEGREHYGFPFGKQPSSRCISKAYLTFCNRVVQRVAATYPRQRFFALIYSATLTPPLDDTLPLHPNLDLCIALPRRYDRPLDAGFTGVEDVTLTRSEKARYTDYPDLLQRWRRLAPHSRIFFHDYHMALNERAAVPMPATAAITGDMALYGRLGLQGYYSQAVPDNFNTYGLNYYAAARAAFDNEQDAEQVVDRYCRGYYGHAATPMRRYHLALERALRGHLLGVTADRLEERLALEPGAIGKPETWLVKAEKAAKTRQERRHVRYARTALQYAVRIGDLIAECEKARRSLSGGSFKKAAKHTASAEKKAAALKAFVTSRLVGQGMFNSARAADARKAVDHACRLGAGFRFVARPDAYYPDQPFRKEPST